MAEKLAATFHPVPLPCPHALYVRLAGEWVCVGCGDQIEDEDDP